MPTYRYECQACGHLFELFQSMTDKLKRKCPACGKPKLDRLIGAGAGVIFKGSGFYQTDYKNTGRPTAEGGSSGESSGEAKPGDKPPAASDSSGGGGSSSSGSSGTAGNAKSADRGKSSKKDSGPKAPKTDK